MPDNKKQSLIKTLLKVAGFAVVSIALTLALIALAFWIYSNNAVKVAAYLPVKTERGYYMDPTLCYLLLRQRAAA